MKTLNKQVKAKILGVKIERKHDPDGDSWYLGKYVGHPPATGFYVDRQEGKMIDAKTGEVVADGLACTFARNEYRYIAGFQHYSISGWEHVGDKGVHRGYLMCRYRFNERAGKSWKKNLFKHYGVKGWETAQTREEKIRVLNVVYSCSDAERLENLAKGDWCYTGVIAKAEVKSPSGVVQTLRSGGLWGVESDADKDHYKEIEEQELSALKDELEAYGFGGRAIAKAFKEVEHVES